MKKITYLENAYYFPENDETLPFPEAATSEMLKHDWQRDAALLRLSGLHVGPAIDVWVTGIEEDLDADEAGTYARWRYQELLWPDGTALADDAEQYIGDFYEDEIRDQITPQ